MKNLLDSNKSSNFAPANKQWSLRLSVRTRDFHSLKSSSTLLADMGKLFGTDGVRGVAGKDLTCELALQIGRATAAELTSLDGHRPRIPVSYTHLVWHGHSTQPSLPAGTARKGSGSLPRGRRNKFITPPAQRNRAFPTGTALLYICLLYTSRCV